MIDQGKGSTDIAMSKETMSRLSNILSELKQETVGAKRTVKIETNDEFIVSGKEDVFKLRLDPEIKIYEPGTRIKQGDIIISTGPDRKSTRLNSSHSQISYAVFCLK